MTGLTFATSAPVVQDPSMEVLAVSLAKSQQKVEGQAIMKLLSAAAMPVPAPSSNPSLGQNVNTFV